MFSYVKSRLIEYLQDTLTGKVLKFTVFSNNHILYDEYYEKLTTTV